MGRRSLAISYEQLTADCVGCRDSLRQANCRSCFSVGPGRASHLTGSDLLMDGGVTASYYFGELAPQS